MSERMRIMRLPENQHGWGVGVITVDHEEIPTNGFTLATFPTEQEQIKYFNEAKQFFQWREADFTI